MMGTVVMCQINDCKKFTSYRINRLKIPNGFLKNVYVCAECERDCTTIL